MTKKQVIIDTNTLVSSILIANSIPDVVLKKVRKDEDLLFSESTFDELKQVLQRPKFNKYVEQNIRDQFLTVLQQEAILIPITTSINLCRDPKDNKFLELAADGQADYLITGDRDLLTLDSFRQTEILTPAQFLDKNLN